MCLGKIGGMIMECVYYALLTKEDEGYVITFPDIPGAISEAEDLEDALKNAREVLEIFMHVYEKEGLQFPTPSNVIELAEHLESEDDLLQIITIE